MIYVCTDDSESGATLFRNGFVACIGLNP